MKGFFKDFKEFALKGNIIDMAVGVIIGGAFGKIVTALVEKIISPLIGLLLGNVNLADKGVELRAAEGEAEALVLQWGAFVQAIIDFLIIALSIFLVLRIIMKAKKKAEALKKKEEEEEKEEEPAETELDILKEIRDSLVKKEACEEEAAPEEEPAPEE